MARQIKTIKIDDLEITVKELRVEDIIAILYSADTEEDLGTMGLIEKHLSKLTDLTIEKGLGMAPSELKKFWETAKEVNADFFDVARALGAERILAEIKDSLQKSFSAIVADSLKKVTQTL